MKRNLMGGCLLLCLAASPSTRGQGPTQAGENNTAAAEYCAKHPTDSQRCLPPHDGIPSLPKSVAKLPGGRIQPGATDACPGCSSKDITSVLDAKPTVHTVPPSTVHSPTLTPPRTSAEPETTSQPPYPVCDSACQQAQNQQNFQNGEAAGYVLGTLISRAVSAHHGDPYKKAKTKYCRLHPDAFWENNDGSISMCDTINAGHEVRQSPDVSGSSAQNPTTISQSRPATVAPAYQQLQGLVDEEEIIEKAAGEANHQADLRDTTPDSSLAQQVRDEMDRNREIARSCLITSSKPPRSYTQAECDSALETWVKQREAYCTLEPNGTYISYVDGKVRSCSEKHE